LYEKTVYKLKLWVIFNPRKNLFSPARKRQQKIRLIFDDFFTDKKPIKIVYCH
jgi:hypothetical protein